MGVLPNISPWRTSSQTGPHAVPKTAVPKHGMGPAAHAVVKLERGDSTPVVSGTGSGDVRNLDGRSATQHTSHVQIHVNRTDGISVNLEFRPDDYVADVKQRISAESGMPLCAIVLISSSGDSLPDDRSILNLSTGDDPIHISLILKDMSEEVKKVVEDIPRNGLKDPNNLLGNRVTAIEAVQQNGLCLQYVSSQLKSDADITLAAVKQNGSALKYASKAYKQNETIVLAAVQQNGTTLKYADEKCKSVEHIVLEAVKQNYDSLRYASEPLRGDNTFMLKAVSLNGNALLHASEELKNDKKVVLAAVHNNGMAIHFANKKFKSDKEIVAAASNSGNDPYRILPLIWAPGK